ncbi:hypothetical protein F25303_11644 [Fusarium sp. NRRL 25303]|nr:hypothetical protein F25303_11644 [Fusarium sp. NRRL 25303]
MLGVIRKAWVWKPKGGISQLYVSMVALDTSRAYNCVDRILLLQTLADRGVATWFLRVIHSFLSDRSIVLKLPQSVSDPFFVNIGVPQGSPLSPLLFLFYTVPLLIMLAEEIKKLDRSYVEVHVFAYMDDTYIMAVSPSYEENCSILKVFHDLIMKWAKDAHLSSSPEKSLVMHFQPGVSDDKQKSDQRKREALGLTGAPKVEPPWTLLPDIDELSNNPKCLQPEKLLVIELMLDPKLLGLSRSCRAKSLEVRPHDFWFNKLPQHYEDGRFHEKFHDYNESAFDVLKRNAQALVKDARKRFQDTRKAIRQQAIRQATEPSKVIWKDHRKERKETKAITYQPPALKEEWGGESLAYYRGVTRPESTLGMQLRTECVGLNWYLNKCHVFREVKPPGSDTVVRVRVEATCTCRHPNQTVYHMFIECPDLHDARLLLIRKVKHFGWETLLTTNLKVAVHWAMMYFGLEQFSLARLDSMFYVDSGGS